MTSPLPSQRPNSGCELSPWQTLPHWLGSGFRQLAPWLAGSRCLECDAMVSTVSTFAICGDCSQTLWGHPRCPRCGDRCHSEEAKAGSCRRCKKHPPPSNGSLSLGPYRGWLRQAILNYKYQHDLLAFRYLSELCLNWPEPQGNLVLCTIPSHHQRLKERKAREQHLPALIQRYLRKTRRERVDLLEKEHYDTAQVHRSGEQRRNASDLHFRYIGPDKVPKIVWLIDDVITTGATLKAATICLKNNGVEEVHWLTLARSSWDA